MNSRKSSRRLPAAKRRELEIAAAVAREAAQRFHVESALRLIELGAERVSAVRMLSIYIRIHGLRTAQAEQLAYSVLAALGNRSVRSELASLFGDDDDLRDVESESLFRIVRNRLRGRVHHDLRRWVELATGEAQAGLLEIHVRHALVFAEELVETHTIAQVSAVYSELAGVPEVLRAPLYIMLMERLAAKELPRRNGAAAREGTPLYARPTVRAKRVV